MGFEIDDKDFVMKVTQIGERVPKAALKAVQKSTLDLEMIATNIAPIDKGTLRGSANAEVQNKGLWIVGEVAFSAVNNGFNYAIWTHEYTYELGPQSKAAPGFAGYSVGNKYLSRPLEGESSKYFRWWADAIKEAID